MDLIDLLKSEELFFYLTSAGLSFVVMLIALSVWMIFMSLFGGLINESSKWPFVLLFVLATSVTPIAIYSIDYWDIDIPFDQLETAYRLEENNIDLSELKEKMTEVRLALKRPGKINLDQVESILTTSLEYTDRVQRILNQNDRLMDEMRREIAREKRNADESRKLALELKSITKEQLNALKGIITEDAKTSSQQYFLLGILASIPVGFFVSLMASRVSRKRQLKKNQTNQ